MKKMILMLILIIVSIFATLWIRSAIIATEYRLSSLEQQKKELLKERRLLIAEKASLTSFARIDATANQEIVLPDRKKVFFIQVTPETFVKPASYKKEK